MTTTHKRSTPAQLQRECNKFNAAIKIGDSVAYQEVMSDTCPVQVFTAQTEAQIMSGHSAVVWLNGKSGCVLVSHCRPATPTDIEAAKARALEVLQAEQAIAAAAAEYSAAPYFMHPDAFRRLRAGEPAACRKRDYAEPKQIRMYEQGLVEALAQSVRELMRLATRNDVPEVKQVEIAERALNLIEKIEADEPCPF
jgi:hypothetical protein